ncbi:MAG TPA: phage integrase N-terminal SAM-like domain-containing protein [Pyrinomonadaceae bacterium]|nr:phage integrase N-terminal SAM-like domain-containing protein [Pyrinomonadaceae bacterium]
MVKKKLLDQVTEVARFRHLSLRTEAAYRNWIKRFILFHHKRHPRELDDDAVRAFLTRFAVTVELTRRLENHPPGSPSSREDEEDRSQLPLISC